MEWYEVAFDRFYPILYSHRDAEEAVHVIDTFGDYLEGKIPVLDMACGDGRYLKALRGAGHRAIGLDLSHYLLLRALEESEHRGMIAQGDMRRLPFLDASFGAVINMFTSFGYFSADTDNLLVFREVRRVLTRRDRFYRETAHVIIDVSERTPDALRGSLPREKRRLF